MTKSPKLIIPKHLVIIPDGNRRWAKAHHLSTFEGHRAGYERLKELAKTARKLGIKTVTVWAFSTENWQREKNEVKYLFDLFSQVVKVLEKDVLENKIRFRHLGRKDRLPKDIIKSLKNLEEKTAKFTKYQFNLALDYGGRDEILRAITKLLAKTSPDKILTEELFASCLDTTGLSDPDLIIRTSGEQRISGLMPWQSVYSEFYFSPLYFPDFDSQALKTALKEFSSRQRRYGK